ncbi:ATP-dependent RecD-like DNA helicase [Streptococcus oricebi]|uniref:ATP-dependent RecD2 DNA helicase n=1 Tax=Streptococcus oricebi TaxID=1547447 RepID=A0ABS5B4J7_9STRE|nr:ATP-dependent RecD-like DNA helicase [Streptococcus oricebi]MBP2623730.1 ATP-dependent RecD-like DNA helicase [Streptococcus oricebi]
MEFFFSGTIERIIFENPSNFFRILVLDIQETDAEDFTDFEIIVTGNMAEVLEGEDYQFWGELIHHPKYGEQLKISRYEKSKPSSQGLVKYFSSEHFKGIGQKTAQKIVDLYGDETIDKILADPERLKKIKGFSKAKRTAFVAKLEANYGAERILAKLAEYGIPNKLAFQIQDYYKEESLNIIENNPYQLAEDIQGLGFTLADRLAEKLGIAADSPQRFRAGLSHCLLQLSMERGDTFVEARDLLEDSLSLLEESRQIELDPVLVADELSNLIAEDKVQTEDSRIFDNSLYFSEEGIASNLLRILAQKTDLEVSPQRIQEVIDQVQTELGIHYDQAQKQAVAQALTNKVFFLTGGPGTGKTTVIRGLIASYAKLHKLDLKEPDLPILLAAPTGRAARRMNELTGLASATIHRHLAMTGDDEEAHLSDYLDADLIIVDEFSMVDTWLANQLLANISSKSQLIIVGDADQLPSVGPGQVLADLLTIEGLPQVRLEKIYRQSEDSTIVTLASQIKAGNLPADFRDKKADRSYFEAESQHIPVMIEKIIAAAIRSGLAPSDIQILAPMYRGAAGIDQLNKLVQDLVNPIQEGQLHFETADSQYRQGDRLIHLINDAERNVFNGDVGKITDLLPAKYSDSKQDELIIDFDGNEVSYPRNEWYKIRLAYAMSIHKSQGSEFPVILLPITSSSHRMLQRNLIYTAITRAKSKLILLGQYEAFDYAVNNTGTGRKTYLVQRFAQSRLTSLEDHTPSITLESKPQALQNPVLTANNLEQIDPMIGIQKEDIQEIFGKTGQNKSS